MDSKAKLTEKTGAYNTQKMKKEHLYGEIQQLKLHLAAMVKKGIDLNATIES